MKINTAKIMKSHYDSDYMGGGKSKNTKRRLHNLFKAKVKKALSEYEFIDD